jgi:NADPH-dependent 2,4-dienoyl-CoA reductase/sulfur reductase-like enzyme
MQFHKQNGVNFHMRATLQSIKPAADNPKAVGSIVLEGGVEIPADIVVMGVGVKPATDFLKGSSLEKAMQKDGGLKVDQSLCVEGFTDVFAIGQLGLVDHINSRDTDALL